MATGEFTPHSPFPDVRHLSDPAILIQAWKKAHAYIQSHNWYADSLELDASALRLHELVSAWSSMLAPERIGRYVPDRMRLVPAPKSGEWKMEDGWKPVGEGELKLRPLAHLSVRDQTVAIAVLICLADAVEAAQGNPTTRINAGTRSNVVSYGHRLVAKWDGDTAKFKWGNAKLYRQYFEDYYRFVNRPERSRQELFPDGGSWAIVHADLSQFYDRIPRGELIKRLHKVASDAYGSSRPDPTFFKALRRLFNWSWADEDLRLATELCRNKPNIGLPQGLAASGFFANVYMLEFDASVVALFGKTFGDHKWRVLDYCRYVDDMRFVVDLEEDDLPTFESDFNAFLKATLRAKAPGLVLNEQKTEVMYGNSHSPNVPVAEAMQAVNKSVSGPLDIETARHALELLDGLLAVSNSRLTQITPTGTGQDDMLRRILSVEPDVRNDTLERFVAHRWRRVYRSMRIMADAEDFTDTTLNVGRQLLDQRAKTFAVDLLRKWILDPSNVRLLRVSLDLYPAEEHLSIVLNLLNSYLNAENAPPDRRCICEYVASEVLRAGATETGFVRDADELPTGVDLGRYRKSLADFALEQMDPAGPGRSWHLRQQSLLALAVFQKYRREEAPEEEIRRHAALHAILLGRWPLAPDGEFERASQAIPLIIIAHRISGNTKKCARLLASWIRRTDPAEVTRGIGEYLTEDLGLLEETLLHLTPRSRLSWTEKCVSIGYIPHPGGARTSGDDGTEVSLLGLLNQDSNPFRQETAALRLAMKVTEQWTQRNRSREGILTPARIGITCGSWATLADPTATLLDADFRVEIHPARDVQDERYRVPGWCPKGERWRNEVGQILRASILGQPDYSGHYRVSRVIDGVSKYQGISSNWYKRQHGLLNQRPGLGDRMLPVSPWLSELLSRLLAWPGVTPMRQLVTLRDNFTPQQLVHCLRQRLQQLAGDYCRLSGMPLYTFPVTELAATTRAGKFKIAVVQTAVPLAGDFKNDLRLDAPKFRRMHRRHLSSMLRLLMKTLDVRNGYREHKEKVDLVVFPELSIHPADIHLLTRFADSTKCIVFCGLVFHPLSHRPNALINSGLWILPVRTDEGRSMHFVEQGKWHMTPSEQSLGITPYRPCQWMIEARSGTGAPWRLTAAICYDATDLSLAADMRNKSDAFIVAALNRDIGTFDAMVTALHYHMFQHVLLVNSAEYGGSTAQAPYSDHYNKVIVHHHGLDQPVVSVIEFDFAKFRGNAKKHPTKSATDCKPAKHPPAGLKR
jgi:hypothetical protein